MPDPRFLQDADMPRPIGESFSDAIDRLLRREKVNRADYFGAIENDDLLKGLEVDSKKIRELSRSGYDCLRYHRPHRPIQRI